MCILIFLFSNQPGEDSSKISDNLFIRKLGHFSEYAILGFWSFIYFANLLIKDINNNKTIRVSIASLIFSMFYAITDEIHQLFVPGRDGNIKDVALDTCGAFFGILVVNILFTYFVTKKSEKNHSL
ncbi:VanZ family protein [Gemella sanguinis]|uniref:VanZ family protein n=1 Tax=Gemella sanguinis TaxID=84135 RepID=UPI002155D56B|nr:VanZ family protein [Gemella sanguinis]